MLELKQIEAFYPEPLRPFKTNLLREYLQYKVLEAIFVSRFANKLSFMGGTAIHIIHANTRFSEDLDFDNIGLDKKGFEQLAGLIKKRLRLIQTHYVLLHYCHSDPERSEGEESFQ